MNKSEINTLLYSIPDNVDYTSIPDEIDLKDVPIERLEKLIALLEVDDESLLFDVSRLLTSWGVREGFDTLRSLLMNNRLQGMIQHRLHGYDDTYKHVLDSIISYWASLSDLGQGTKARQEIFEPISKIIKDSNLQSFGISRVFYLILRKEFYEYIPLLKEHLEIIIKKPEDNYWRIKDAVDLFLKIDPEFVKAVLNNNAKTLADFGLNENL